MIITIDGSAGTGKSTVAKRLSESLGFVFFDTGAMYRAFTWFLLQKEIDVEDLGLVEKALSQFSFSIRTQGSDKLYFVNKEDVTDSIRSTSVNEGVSKVAALSAVRRSMHRIQKEFAKGINSVFEGRDMGSAVFPEAEVKVYLTAKPEVAAQRRLKELIKKYPEEYSQSDQNKVKEALLKRDALDSQRELAPLYCPKDAFVIDTSEMSVDEVVKQILTYIKSHETIL